MWRSGMRKENTLPMQRINHAYAVIMAGGGGTRLWPLSRQATPKQLLNLFDGKTLFELAVERLQGLFPPEHILVVTIAEQAEKLKKITPHIPENNYLIEPMPRGTAAVVAMAAAAIVKRDPEGIMVVLTADHYIEKVDEFRAILIAGCEFANRGPLVTLGIKPTYPATGYGYIEAGENLNSYGDYTIKQVVRFEEKPDENRAIDFLKSGQYYWNSGMFIWKASVIQDEFSRHMPALAEILMEIQHYIGVDHTSISFSEKWQSITPQTIDFGIMEKSDNVVVIPVEEIGWNDVGFWDSLFDLMPADENGNIILGTQIYPLESKSIFVFSNEKKKMIIPLGVQNMIIVNTPDALLICPRGESQKVKMLVEYLKANHFTLFL